MSTDNELIKESLYTRTAMMLGDDAINRLKSARVAIFGVGGVGGFATEAIARAGVGGITLIDSDKVSVSNLNRQIIALNSTVGRFKTEVMRERILDINPDCRVEIFSEFYSAENAEIFNLSSYDYVIDAIDSVKSKLDLIERTVKLGVPIISCMGAGNKLDPSRFRVSDISKTTVDPLAKVVRTELRHRGINHLKVVFSDEEPVNPQRSRIPGSLSFVPSAAGLILASEVILDISDTR